jgi:proteasome lid subunit RPN8/RPN11
VLPDGEILRARNRSPFPETSFAADGRTTLRARELGATFLYHSHPEGSAQPSALDQASCKKLGIPYLVYGVKGDEFEIFDPTPAWHQLLELHWDWGRQDCFSMVRDYFRVCHEIEIPEHDRPDPFPPEYNFFHMLHEDMGFRVVEKPPREHDVISLHFGCRFENHLAVVLGDQVLHHAKDRLSQREDFTKAWRDRIVHVYRHEEVA